MRPGRSSERAQSSRIQPRPHAQLDTVAPPKLTQRTLERISKRDRPARDISSWAASTTGSADDSDTMAAQRDELDWPDLVKEARTALSGSRTKERTETLAELRVWATKREWSDLAGAGGARVGSRVHSTASLEPAQVQDLVRLLVSTVPRYVDSTSRQAVLAVLSTLLARDYASSRDDAAATSNGKTASLTNGLIKWLEGEAAKVDKTGAGSTRFALLAWANTIYSAVPAVHPLEDAPFVSLAVTLSNLLNAVLDEANGAKDSIRKSALVSTRRAVRTVSLLRVCAALCVLTSHRAASRVAPSPRQDSRVCQSRSQLPPCVLDRPRDGRCLALEGSERAEGPRQELR